MSNLDHDTSPSALSDAQRARSYAFGVGITLICMLIVGLSAKDDDKSLFMIGFFPLTCCIVMCIRYASRTISQNNAKTRK
jgi:hypothetical protein